MIPIITIDGFSGVGKGTLALRLADHFSYHLLDSGAIYRALALYASDLGVDLKDEEAIKLLANTLPLNFKTDKNVIEIILNNKNVSSLIRTENIGNNASVVAKYPSVREALIEFQRNYARPPGLVADGRDMGTTIFPNATYKFFLKADSKVRAERRYSQLLSQGFSVNIATIIEEIETRDHRDQNRSASPLIPAKDAVIIDTSELDRDQVFDQVLSYINNH